MSEVTISYRSLENAAGEASDVAKRLGTYGDALGRDIQKKLESYSGGTTFNVSTAISQTKEKISALGSMESRYKGYAARLKELKSTCQQTDKDVSQKVSSLTGRFKEAHDISNNPITNAFSYFFTAMDNSTAVGRWIGDKEDEFDAKVDEYKQAILDKFRYEGGKEFWKGIGEAALKAITGTIKLALGLIALFEGGSILALIAAVALIVDGALTAFNSGINIGAEYDARKNYAGNDPATARRTSDINSVQDMWRRTDSEDAHRAAKIVDGVDFVCKVIGAVKAVGDLGKSVVKWATGGANKSWTGLFTKEFWSKTGEKWTDFSMSFKKSGFKVFGDMFKNLYHDIGTNLKKEFCDFKGPEEAVKTIKNFTELGLDLYDDRPGLSLFLDIVPPALTLIPGADNYTGGDFVEMIDKWLKAKKSGAGLFDHSSILPKDLTWNLNDTLSRRSDVSVCVGDFSGLTWNIPSLASA